MLPYYGCWSSALCLWLLTLAARANSDVTPYFIEEPLSTIQKPRGHLKLHCSANPPWSHISWLFNGKQVDTLETQDVEIKSGYLTITSLAMSHAGKYQCVASTSEGATLSTPASVSIAYLGEFETSAQSSVKADEGSSALIGCKLPASNPKPHIRYKVRGKWIEKSTDKFLILPSGNLQILNVSSEDRGSYKCAAYNPVTEEQKVNPTTYKLTINRSLQHSSNILNPIPTETLSVQIHEPLTLECVFGGVLYSHITWTKDGHDITELDRRRVFHTHLVIERVERSDAGNYSCFLKNSHHLHYVNYTVIVLEPPAITRGPEDHVALIGSTVRFICEARANPVPNITWVHNGTLIHPTSRYHLLGNKLRVSNINTEDSGIFQCVMDNGVGVALAAARLDVQSAFYSSADNDSSPIIVSPPTNVSVISGDLVTLTCNASGVPTPFIRWYDAHGIIRSHPSQVLRPKSRKAAQSRAADTTSKQDLVPLLISQAGSSSLSIRFATVQHAGKYKCEASNQFGSSSAEAFLSVVPYETNTQPRDQEHVQSDEEDDESAVRTSTATSTSATTDKPPNGAALPEAPIILSPPQATKPDMYFLVWRSGKDGGLPINAYFVRYRKLDDEGNMVGNWNSIRVPASESEFPLTELEPSSLYEVLMVARNAAGEGQPAMLTFRTSKERNSSSKNTQAPSPRHTSPHEGSNANFGVVTLGTFRHSGVPEAPDRPTISTASETSVYVTWIPRANGGSPITSFKVEYKRAGKNWLTAAEHIPPSKLSVEVSELEPGSVYKFRVIAINHYGESQRSTVSRPYQVAGYSNHVSNPLIVGPRIDHTEAVTDTQILLKWTYIPANNNNTPIQGFYIYYRPTDSDNDSDYKRDIVAAGTKHRHLIRDLLPETSYDIKMQCYNERGASDFSNVMICETKARRNPGASEYTVLDFSTPSTVEHAAGSSSSSSNSLTRSGDMLYVIVGCVLGGMVLILMAFIAMCLLKHRQQSLMQKFEPPGYLYQGADLNGQIIEYTALAGTNHVNGNAHSGFMGNGNISNICHHIHPYVNGGTSGVMNGDICPGCTSSLKAKYIENLSQHLTNGGVLYTAIPQTDPNDCINCRNCCNNNRCFTKSNAPYNCVNALPVVPTFLEDSLEAPAQNFDVTASCLSSCEAEDVGEITENQSPNSQCPSTQEEDENTLCHKGEDCPNTVVSSSSITWTPLSLTAFSKDCSEKPDWTTTDITLSGCTADQAAL
ncbi:cell adhesion molecule-related down-regulated by oncogenes [Pelobates cultripes]|uniref:Cell adhesion molecule-related/down-regulated by oncogenes n=1 Tax=Pelobates cultripes TaxID=61616 RepID=A0AAD1WRR4_PELCU|nr:cell adhesion molecule-related down-regulated by oncogenes [Pelobates cultripes]